MFRTSVVGAGLVALMCVMLLPKVARAQTATFGSIAGVVKDTSGAVLAGVTVEAASPALIEKVRSVVTDGQGQYQIVNLRPGAYTVTFTLSGFNTFRREGIELTTAFTAVVNADMAVGSLEETVTVTGASPVVDTRNTRTQTVLSKEVLDTLPTGKATGGYAALIVGAQLTGPVGAMQDVGGNKGEQYGEIVIHGGRYGEGIMTYDGMRYSGMNASGGGANHYWTPNLVAVEEVNFETGGMSAEAETGGVHQNSVPKDGGNTFKVYFAGTGNTGALQASNLTDELRARGLQSESRVKRNFDVGIGLGGPIKRDKLWFYTAHRWWSAQEYYAGTYFNTHGRNSMLYEPDLSRQAFSDYKFRDNSVRLTWQAASKHKVTFMQSVQDNCQCSVYLVQERQPRAPENMYSAEFWPTALTQTVWSYPATSRLLFEAGATISKQPKRIFNDSSDRAGGAISILERSSSLRYNAPDNGLDSIALNDGGDRYDQHNEKVSVSYITGSHAFKVGLVTLFGVQDFVLREVPGNLYYEFLNGSPVALTQWASPSAALSTISTLGIFAQDQWTIKRLTLNLGLRYDQFKGLVPEQDRPGGFFVPALHVDRIENTPDYKDISPRLGTAYDLFGNGKTAVKWSLGRYLAALGPTAAQLTNPTTLLVRSANRTWTDLNKDFIPDCDLKNLDANGECGKLDNQKFGTINPNRTYADDVLRGWATRTYNWQTVVSVQHELRPGVSVNAGYFRSWYGNFQALDNVLVTPADFDPYCITAPVDARLPNGGGYPVCGLYDINPSKFGQVQEVVTQSSHFGNRREVYNGVDATFNWRFGRGGLLQGGTNFGRTVTECVQPDKPQQFCVNVPPFFRPQLKLAGSYRLPLWDLSVSGTFQTLPGISIGFVGASGLVGLETQGAAQNSGTYSATNREIAPSLGRNLASGAAGVASVSLLEPNKYFEDRLNQLDIRFSKAIQVGRGRVRGNFDIYNVFNSAAVLSLNAFYPRNYLKPAQILGGRLLKFSATFDY
ncbi:MAG TPA: carboxypeptidase regulatory-like domain-containing protein [Vicinamibacterales bacterium]|nr:carboxypeptidase regulatory-like domain-containing protein [Vicinamibacterales bacterium]